MDIQEDAVFSKMFDDAKELKKDKMEEISREYVADGMAKNEALREANAEMMKEYKADFFQQYSDLLESLYHLRNNAIHNLITGEIDELSGKNRDFTKIIRWVLAKNKFMFQDLFFKDSEDEEDSENEQSSEDEKDSETEEDSDDKDSDTEVTDMENEPISESVY